MRYTLMFGVCLLLSCHSPVPPPIQPPLVRARDLVQSFRLSSDTAKDAYADQRVILIVDNYVVGDREIHWHLGSDKVPAVLVCEMVEPLAGIKGTIWISARCNGRIRDGVDREIVGYDFHVLLTDGRVVQPPRPKP